jgi:hypothetical protein
MLVDAGKIDGDTACDADTPFDQVCHVTNDGWIHPLDTTRTRDSLHIYFLHANSPKEVAPLESFMDTRDELLQAITRHAKVMKELEITEPETSDATPKKKTAAKPAAKEPESEEEEQAMVVVPPPSPVVKEKKKEKKKRTTRVKDVASDAEEPAKPVKPKPTPKKKAPPQSVAEEEPSSQEKVAQSDATLKRKNGEMPGSPAKKVKMTSPVVPSEDLITALLREKNITDSQIAVKLRNLSMGYDVVTRGDLLMDLELILSCRDYK